jgi:HPr kinase/phosphorylase
MKKLTVNDILVKNKQRKDILKLRNLTGEKGLGREVRRLELNRPGLALAGYFHDFANDRIQIFGKGESAFLGSRNETALKSSLLKIFKYDVNLCIFTHGSRVPKKFLSSATAHGTPVLVSSLPTSEFIMLLTRILEESLAPSITVHGVLIEIFGVGVLITGSSGIGKSETALELVKRGHRLIADDAVRIRKVSGSLLLGNVNENTRHLIEIRGLGIVDIEKVYGFGAVKNSKRVDLIIRLQDWSKVRNVERLGGSRKYQKILNVPVPFLVIPVKTGRNIPVIIETAAMNKRLQDAGYDVLREFSETRRKNGLTSRTGS